MRLETYLALKYLRARKGRLISFVAFVSIVGIALSVASLIVVIAVMTGFTNNLKKALIDTSAHIYIVGWEGKTHEAEIPQIRKVLRKRDWVLKDAPFIYTQAMIRKGNIISAIHVKGVDVEEEKELTSLPERITIGSWNCLKEPGNIAIGKALSENLAILPQDKLVLITPKTVMTPFGVLPVTKETTVCAIFDTGMYNIDSNLIITSLETAKDIAGYEKNYTGLELKVKDPMHADRYANIISLDLKKGYLVKDWISMNRSIFSALKLEKIAMFIILSLMVLVASFSVISTLSMTVMEKEKDIAILSAMGMPPEKIGRIFLIQGLVMGLVGTTLGVFLGVGICFILRKYQIITLPKDIYYIDRIPVEVNLQDIGLIVLVSIIISLVSTYLPSRQATKVNPIDILRISG